MKRTSLSLAMVVMLFGVIAIVIGGVFVFQGVTKNNLLASSLRTEKVTLGIEKILADKGDVVDTLDEALKASNTLREHRAKIAPSYADLLGGKQFDPTNPTQLTYGQALNLEMYLDLSVLAFGMTQMALAIGAALIIIGVALGSMGAIQLQLAKKVN